MARLQKKVQVNTRYRVEKAIGKTAADATAGDNGGGFSGQSLREGGVLGSVEQEGNFYFLETYPHTN